MYCMTPWPSSRCVEGTVPSVPAASTAAAPATGTIAAQPGYSVWSVYRKAVATIAARPVQASVARTHCGMTSRLCASASSAPAPSSHARVWMEKYDREVSCGVCRIDARRVPADRRTMAPTIIFL
jgi:hypothetical protein